MFDREPWLSVANVIVHAIDADENELYPKSNLSWVFQTQTDLGLPVCGLQIVTESSRFKTTFPFSSATYTENNINIAPRQRSSLCSVWGLHKVSTSRSQLRCQLWYCVSYTIKLHQIAHSSFTNRTEAGSATVCPFLFFPFGLPSLHIKLELASHMCPSRVAH